MSSLCRGTDIVLNYLMVSKPDAFQARRLVRHLSRQINGYPNGYTVNEAGN